MSLVGMRIALGEALSHAASRKQVDAVIALIQMVESDFEGSMIGRSADRLGSQISGGIAARNSTSTSNVGA